MWKLGHSVCFFFFGLTRLLLDLHAWLLKTRRKLTKSLSDGRLPGHEALRRQ